MRKQETEPNHNSNADLINTIADMIDYTDRWEIPTEGWRFIATQLRNLADECDARANIPTPKRH